MSAPLETIPPRASGSRQSGQTIGLLVLTTILGVCAVAARLSFLSRPFMHDAGVFIYLGKLTAEGGRFCHDVIDNKLPTVGLLTSVLWRAFGAHWPAYVLTQLGLGLGAPLLLARMAGRHIHVGAGAAVGLFALVFFNFDVLAFSGFQLETIESFFAILAAGAALEAIAEDSPLDSFAAGLAAAVAAMAKPTGLAVLGAFGATMILVKLGAAGFADRAAHSRSDWREACRRLGLHAVAAVAGAAIPLAVCVAYLRAADILQDMPGLFRQIARYGADTPWAWGELTKPVIFAVLVGFPFVVRGFIFRRSRGGEEMVELLPDAIDPRRGPIWRTATVTIFAALWFALEAVGIVLQRRAYAYHFLVLIPPAALLFGLIPRPARASQLAAALLPAAAFSVAMALPGLLAIPVTPERLPVSDYLAAHTVSGDAVWQDEFPRLLIETGLRPGARLPLTFLYLNYDEAPIDFCRQFLNDLRERKPRYVVLPSDVEGKIKMETSLDPPLVRSPKRGANYAVAWRAMHQFVVQNYAAETVIGKETVYRRNDAAMAGVSSSTDFLQP